MEYLFMITDLQGRIELFWYRMSEERVTILCKMARVPLAGG